MPDFSNHSLRRGVAVACAVAFCAFPMAAIVLAPFPVMAESSVRSGLTDLDVLLALARPGPFRAALLDDPPRLALDLEAAIVPPKIDRAFRVERRTDGAIRLETSLPSPMAIERATMTAAPDGQGAQLALRLRRVSSRDFEALAVAPDPATPAAAATTADASRLTIALDPGHGGSDPGATHGDLHEADLMLTFAEELKADLLRTTEFDVVLTRTEDLYVPLRARRARARLAGADLFLSLHADGIEYGSASGAAIFTHGYGPASVVPDTIRGHRDAVPTSARGAPPAPVLTDTPYRSQDLALAIVEAMAAAELPLYKHPRQEADFVVLRARDMPSVLVELGFLTEPADRARIVDPGWRARMAAALRRGVLRWAQRDASVAAVQLQ